MKYETGLIYGVFDDLKLHQNYHFEVKVYEYRTKVDLYRLRFLRKENEGFMLTEIYDVQAMEGLDFLVTQPKKSLGDRLMDKFEKYALEK